ncbi:hypothetical protein K466DRAFT_605926 [Polyporus arcularius HHB13444]|uniref:Uncharacterized protein n=1 Tax=Polyporus arcularius HHB13444 TaxID=1314778 RepID=A0A5C3NQX0_9APHY|nr:hypothetical protein K466DRAFT_605926 [Polyporus arcularius HHB13444]
MPPSQTPPELTGDPQVAAKLKNAKELRRERNKRYYQRCKERRALPSRTSESKAQDLRRERNRRYNQRRKEGRTPATNTAGLIGEKTLHQAQSQSELLLNLGRLEYNEQVAQVAVSSSYLYRKPIRIALCPCFEYNYRLKSLNAALSAWNLVDDTAQFSSLLAEEIARAGEEDNGQQWSFLRQEWLVQGDKLLDEMQDIVGSEFIDDMRPEVRSDLWADISSAAFKVRYMMSIVQAQLHTFKRGL